MQRNGSNGHERERETDGTGKAHVCPVVREYAPDGAGRGKGKGLRTVGSVGRTFLQANTKRQRRRRTRRVIGRGHAARLRTSSQGRRNRVCSIGSVDAPDELPRGAVARTRAERLRPGATRRDGTGRSEERAAAGKLEKPFFTTPVITQHLRRFSYVIAHLQNFSVVRRRP